MREINPEETDRAISYQLYIDAPMPMVTIFKALDITKLVRLSKKGYKLNMLICYCIVTAANKIKEFRLLPVGKKLIEYDNIDINVIVANKKGGINSCDIPFNNDFKLFNLSYIELTEKVYNTCENHEIYNSMIVGTSCLAKSNIDGAVNFYSGIFNNPFLIWGKYYKKNFKKWINISFQFHHVQMDGEHACFFLDSVQDIIYKISS